MILAYGMTLFGGIIICLFETHVIVPPVWYQNEFEGSQSTKVT